MKIIPIKAICALLLCMEIGKLMFLGASWPNVSARLAGVLTILLLSKESINDERVESLKLKAISYGVAVGITSALGANLITKMRHQVGTPPILSAFDLIIMAMIIALGLFYFWRWRDGRTAAGV